MVNYAIPCTLGLKDKIQVGQTITFSGETKKEGKCIEINFLSDGKNTEKSDIIFHMKLYLIPKGNFGKHTVFSAKYDGNWHDQLLMKDQFVKFGEKFQIRIRALTDHYEVRINGKIVYKFDYEHTKPIDRVQSLQVNGDVVIENIRWAGQIYSVPWEMAMPGRKPLHYNKKIIICGVTEGDWHADLVDKKGTVVCRFNPRLKEKIMYHSAILMDKEWGKEEKEGISPFEKDKGFKLTITNAPYGLQFHVDGKHVAAFAHRTKDPNQDYVGLKIDGKLELTEIDFD